MEKEKYIFSVVIPIYNVEKYLEETIESVIKQDIGFSTNIQIILVNDGSKDKSEDICLKYQKLYPNNIKYIYQENKGVSEARNNGIKYIEGKYVNFLDADDIWDLDVFTKVYKFFKEHEKEIDIIACRQKFFEAKEGYHKLDYKFQDGNKIVDITKDYEYIQLSTSSAFIKSEVIKRYTYDIRLKYSEDAKLIGEILMEKLKYGILADAIYNYRKRKENTSALQVREGNKSWYFDTIKYGYNVLIEKSIEKYNILLPYFQYQIMYDLEWRINVDITLYLTENEQKDYIREIIKLLSVIDDNIILKQKYLWTEYKILALCLKYKKDIRKEFEYKDDVIYFKQMKIFKIKNNSLLKINSLDIENNKFIKIEGIINCFLPKDEYKIYIKNEKEKINIEDYKIEQNRPSIVGNLDNYKTFRCNIPIKQELTEIKIMIEYKEKQRRLNLIYGILAKLSNENNDLKYIKNGYIIYSEKNILYIKRTNRKEIIQEKMKYEEILKSRSDIIKLRKKANKLYKINRYIKFEDNEMYILKTIKKWKNELLKDKNWKLVSDINIKKELILKSKIIVGTEKEIYEIFGEDEKYIKDMYNFKYIDIKTIKN